jgi:hypothetical protein
MKKKMALQRSSGVLFLADNSAFRSQSFCSPLLHKKDFRSSRAADFSNQPMTLIKI